jgi:hypothetical protein
MTMEQQPANPPAQRATDHDRDAAAAVVQEAHGDGRLDVEELDDRLGRIYSAKTTQELQVVTADLVPAHGGSNNMVLRSRHGHQKREGHWRVPAQILVDMQHGTARLDFTEAVMTHREVLVEVATRHSSVTVIVPPGWAVDLDEIATEHGAVRNKATAPRPGAPRVRVAGRIKHGKVVVRHPRQRRWWWPFGSR